MDYKNERWSDKKAVTFIKFSEKEKCNFDDKLFSFLQTIKV